MFLVVFNLYSLFLALEHCTLHWSTVVVFLNVLYKEIAIKIEIIGQ